MCLQSTTLINITQYLLPRKFGWIQNLKIKRINYDLPICAIFRYCKVSKFKWSDTQNL